jgi:competence ComEA-like helix-hairpin-helix protein
MICGRRGRLRLPGISLPTLLWVGIFLASAAGAAWAQKKPPASPIDPNTATVEQLEQLPGIGPSTAKAIIQFREKTRFERIEDLLAIHGISKRRLEKIRPYLRINPPAKAYSRKTKNPTTDGHRQDTDEHG